MEVTSGLPLQPANAVVDTDVIWLHKGKTSYEATIVGSRKGLFLESNQMKEAQKDQQAREILSTSPAKTDGHVDTGCSEKEEDSSEPEEGTCIYYTCILTLFTSVFVLQYWIVYLPLNAKNQVTQSPQLPQLLNQAD